MFEYLVTDAIHDVILAYDASANKYALAQGRNAAFVYIEKVKTHKQAFKFYLDAVQKKGK